jgi:hypothetical protein
MPAKSPNNRARMILLLKQQMSGEGESAPPRTHLRVGQVQAAFRRVIKDAEVLAQHGPVKVLWKDGTPVTD